MACWYECELRNNSYTTRFNIRRHFTDLHPLKCARKVKQHATDTPKRTNAVLVLVLAKCLNEPSNYIQNIALDEIMTYITIQYIIYIILQQKVNTAKQMYMDCIYTVLFSPALQYCLTFTIHTHTFTHRRRSQPCRATASSLGAVGVRCLAQAHLNTQLGGAGD